MSLVNIVLWLIFGALIGWVASAIMNTDAEQGPLANIVVGIIGAFVGGTVSSWLGGPGVTGFDLISFGIALLGAIALLAIYKGFTYRRVH